MKPTNVTDNDWKLLTEKYSNMEPIVKKIEEHYPIQYLIGNVDFYGYNIDVKQGVLIPRFETEELVSRTLELIKELDMTDASVLDIGTGTGCIPIAMKKEMPSLYITAIDISNKAISLAKHNARMNKCDITFILKSLYKFKPINRYDVIISNPPYVDREEEVGPEIQFEPESAIFANDKGLEHYKFILNNYNKYLNKKFIMAFEIGYKQGNELKKLAKELYPKSEIKIEKDLSGFDRFLFVINK